MKNKKNKIILLISVAAVVVLVGVLLLLIFMPDGTKGDATYDEGINLSNAVDENGVHQAQVITNEKGEIDNNSYGTLLKYVPADISSIHVENSQGSFDVLSDTPVNENGETQATIYTIKGYEDFDLQSSIPDEIASAASQLDFSKVVSLDGKNSSDYGFDNPKSTVTVYYDDKTSAKIIVGDNAPQETGTYIKFGDSDTIYIVTVDAVAPFSYGLTDLFSLTINDSASNTENSQANKITLGGTHLDKEIVIEPNTNTAISASYVMTSPIKGYASETGSSNVDGDIRGLYATKVKMVNPTDTQLKELGLDKPYATVKAEYPDTTVELIAAKPDSEGTVIMMIKGGNVVYEIGKDSVTWVEITLDEMLSEYMLTPSMVALSKVTVNDGKKDYEFVLSSTTTTNADDEGNETTTTTTTVKYGNTEIDLGKFSTYFQNITLITRADDKTESFSGNPVLSVKYEYSSDKSSDTVSFYSTGNDRYLAVVNGTAIGHVYKSGINNIVNQTSQVADNKQVDSL
ncbi:MAG: DUF4340 domain-containing protein [Ruminococcus sp.]|nr:DUF4340 domain-containing protein [Ruminococcus sp.]